MAPALLEQGIEVPDGKTVDVKTVEVQPEPQHGSLEVQQQGIEVSNGKTVDVKTVEVQPKPQHGSLEVQQPNVQDITAPPKKWIPKCHPLEPEITAQVDGWFLKHWPFPNAKAEKKFVGAGFSRVTCLYFPLSRDDRIHHACRLLTILFLIDDILDDMSFDDGEAYNNHLMPIMRGEAPADPDRPVEWMMKQIWDEMRQDDYQLAQETLEPTFTFMRAQTDRSRAHMRNLGQYLIYRERDVGKALLSYLMKYSMGLHLSPAETAMVQPFERNCAKQISIVNDICSFEKEVLASQTSTAEGAALCSAVSILAEETELCVGASKTIMWAMAREWERKHDEGVERLWIGEDVSGRVLRYLKGLEYQMSGNEEWSLSTLRYTDVSPA